VFLWSQLNCPFPLRDPLCTAAVLQPILHQWCQDRHIPNWPEPPDDYDVLQLHHLQHPQHLCKRSAFSMCSPTLQLLSCITSLCSTLMLGQPWAPLDFWTRLLPFCTTWCLPLIQPIHPHPEKQELKTSINKLPLFPKWHWGRKRTHTGLILNLGDIGWDITQDGCPTVCLWRTPYFVPENTWFTTFLKI
jgi:hypothetical protein